LIFIHGFLQLICFDSRSGSVGDCSSPTGPGTQESNPWRSRWREYLVGLGWSVRQRINRIDTAAYVKHFESCIIGRPRSAQIKKSPFEQFLNERANVESVSSLEGEEEQGNSGEEYTDRSYFDDIEQ
jgi:hypothetical protein